MTTLHFQTSHISPQHQATINAQAAVSYAQVSAPQPRTGVESIGQDLRVAQDKGLLKCQLFDMASASFASGVLLANGISVAASAATYSNTNVKIAFGVSGAALIVGSLSVAAIAAATASEIGSANNACSGKAN